MAGAKETPRQRMIAMMYLVLTALLALNVSKQVIDAFVVVNETVELTNEKFIQRLKNAYILFEKMYQLNQTEVQPYWSKAMEAKALSAEMTSYIINLRDNLIAETEGISIDSARVSELKDLKKKDNYSITTSYFMGDSYDGSKGKSSELKEKILNYKKTMIEMIDTKNRDHLKLGLVTDSVYYDADGQKQNWEAHYFYNTILAADITILNKIISEVYDAEFGVVSGLMDEINADDFSYDKIDAKVISNSNYIFIGDEYKAEVFVAAYDTSQGPEVYIMRGVDSLPVSQKENATLLNSTNGPTNIRLPAQNEGLNKYAGFVSVKTSSGETNYYHFSNQYVVAKPSVTVSVEEMNVVYIGVDNTVSISASGIANENIVPTISCGTIKPGSSGDKWLVNVPQDEKQAIITVSSNINGIIKELGSQRFRIKRLPDPVAMIGSISEGFINREILIAAGAIIPQMPKDFNFAHYFEIESFKMTIPRGFNTYNYTSNSGVLTDEMIQQIDMTNRGQRILFENIIAVGPYGDKRSLSPIILTIN